MEGVTDLARAFLAAGVPSVLATLWDVEDRATGRFLDLFYAHLLQGNDVMSSLQAAQIASLRSLDESLRSPRSWAAFNLVGASPEIIHGIERR